MTDLYDSLSATVGDSTKNCAYTNYYKCTGTVPTNIFGDPTYKINFYYYLYGANWSDNMSKNYVKKYGLIGITGSSYGGGHGTSHGFTLKVVK